MSSIHYRSTVETTDGRVVVTVEGDVDLYSAPDLRSDLLNATEGSTGDVVVDLSAVGFLDSTGLGVLLGALRRLREDQRSMELIAATPAVLRILEVTGLEKVFAMQKPARAQRKQRDT